MNRALIGVVAFAAGLVVGYAVFAPDSSTGPASTHSDHTSIDEPGAARVATRSAAAPASAAGPTVSPRPHTAPVIVPELAAGSPPLPASPPQSPEAAALARRIEQLELQLHQERALRSGAEESPPIAPRNDLPPRFATDALGASVQAGLKQLGVQAQVTSVDCTEFPCIVYGEGFGGFDDAQALFKSAALGSYSKDERRVWGWTTEAKGQNPAKRSFFALAFYPGDGQENAELAKRMDTRVIQMKDATR